MSISNYGLYYYEQESKKHILIAVFVTIDEMAKFIESYSNSWPDEIRENLKVVEIVE